MMVESGFVPTTPLLAEDDSLRQELISLLEREDRKVNELTWAIFCSAACSFKQDSLLRPFPPSVSRDGNTKDFTRLQSLIRSIDLNNVNRMDTDQISLVHWVLTQSPVSLVRAQLDELLPVLSQNGLSTAAAAQPDYIFAVKYKERSEQNFERRKGDRPSLYAFHGSNLCNFYSILAHGLIGNLNKTSAFGEGTYLSNELSVSLNWSPLAKPGIARLRLGERMGCVALCQIIHDPNGLRRGTRSAQFDSGSKVPEAYVLVRDDSLIRLRYLLLYTEQHKTTPRSRACDWLVSSRNWLRVHRFWLLMLAYIGVLILIGLASSNNLKFYWNRLSHYWSLDYYRHEET